MTNPWDNFTRWVKAQVRPVREDYLDELQAKLQTRDIHYWRDKKGHEVDFVLPKRGGPPIAIEAKWKADAFEPGSLQALLRRYPSAHCYVVTSDVSSESAL